MTAPGYIDNNQLHRSSTVQIRGNAVTDVTGTTASVAFSIQNLDNVLVKNNKAARIRSSANNAIGYYVSGDTWAVLHYNVSSRTNTGYYFSRLSTLDVYNTTAHNCSRGIYSSVSGTFRNIAISVYPDSSLYRNAYGIYSDAGASQNVDYVYHTGLTALVEFGTVVEGSTVEEKRILYLDEPNDDLTPDYISELVNSGSTNPFYTEPDIGGVETSITDENSCKINFFYDLIDNVFWDIDNEKAAEVTLIKALQSRALAASEVDERNMERDLYLNQLVTTDRFSERFPMYARYLSDNNFKKNVRDMTYATQNPATLSAYNSGIGGYNLFPSFLQRMEDNQDGWIIDESYVGWNNWLHSQWGLAYGIFIDVLGTSTISAAASAECYTNVMNCVADIAPVGWFLHEEAQPTDYFLFTEGWNGFEECTLTNMYYNDDYALVVDDRSILGTAITPCFSTLTPLSSGVSTITTGPSGGIEISLLDRVYSETIDRKFYYRVGLSPGTLGSWTELTRHVSVPIYTTYPYIQFKITVDYVLRNADYEFIALATRPYNPVRDWTKT